MTTTAQTVYFVPQAKIISNITNANPAIVTTTSAHHYNDGLYIRISVPTSQQIGMPYINNQLFYITVLSSDTFSINVDTSRLDPFIPSLLQSIQSIPVAERSNTLVNAERNGLPPIAGT